MLTGNRTILSAVGGIVAILVYLLNAQGIVVSAEQQEALKNWMLGTAGVLYFASQIFQALKGKRIEKSLNEKK